MQRNSCWPLSVWHCYNWESSLFHESLPQNLMKCVLSIAVVQSLSHVWLFATPWTATCQAPLYFTHLHWVSDAIQPSHPLSPRFPPAFNLSQHQSFPMSWLFASGGQSEGGASASASALPKISFRIDWFDFLTVQGTLKCLLQHHSLKASILWRSTLFMVQLSHAYMTTGKTIALSI